MLLNLCKYNIWANQKITEYILAAGNEIADVELQSSFPTIRKTLYHIWDAQAIWYSRLKGVSFNSWPSKDFTGTLDEACAGLLLSSREFISLVENCNGDFSRVVTYQTLDGKEFKNTVEEVVTHCMNHGTYHRGQLITMLRQAGFKQVGSTDYIRFARENH